MKEINFIMAWLFAVSLGQSCDEDGKLHLTFAVNPNSEISSYLFFIRTANYFLSVAAA
jgi:hypothetical protein